MSDSGGQIGKAGFGGRIGDPDFPAEGDDDLAWLDAYYYDRFPEQAPDRRAWMRLAAAVSIAAALTFLLCYPASCALG